MGNFLQHPANADSAKRGIYKGLHVGESGTGKTGGLVSLIKAGYKLRIADFDRGLDPIAGYIGADRAKLANVDYETFVDEFRLTGGALVVKKAPSFGRFLGLLENWGEFGPVQSWGDDTVLVIDTLGSLSRASFHMVLQANGVVLPQGTKGGPEQGHWGTAQDNIDRLLMQLTDPKLVPCHLIVNAHWTFQELADGSTKFFPEALGKALNPKIAKHFNNMLGFSLTAGQRKIKVVNDGLIALKTAKPMAKKEYDIATGLGEIFKEIVGPPPAGA